MNSTHTQDIARKAEEELGDRWDKIGPLDLTRNPLVRYVTTLGTAHARPAGISGAPAGLLDMIGGERSRPLIRSYTKAGYRPMPVALAEISADAERYDLGCHYCGVRATWNDRGEFPSLDVITPDTLTLDYRLDDSRRPSVYRHDLRRMVEGRMQDVTDVYDLTDPDAPVFRTVVGRKDVTLAAHPGGGLTGDNWPGEWRTADGEPRAPIVVYGRPTNLSRLLELVEGTLRVCVGWSWWWAGYRDACYKGRNVRGMVLAGSDSAMDAGGEGDGGTGIATGAEDVLRWVDTDPDKPGEHWQWDAPFDAKAMAESLQTYENGLLSHLGVPVDLTKTGGEPLAQEAEALRQAAMRHYDDLRAGDAEVLRLVAMLANRHGAGSFDETARYAVSYNEEIAEELAAAARPEPPEEDSNGRGIEDGDTDGRGSPGEGGGSPGAADEGGA